MKGSEMSIIELLASSQGTRKNDANMALAESVAASGNSEAVAELVGLLSHKDRNIQSDAIKTLYETGFRNPELIAPHWEVFTGLLTSRNNRLVWGAMAALTSIVPYRHRKLFDSLDQIMFAIDHGSVITIDGGVDILAKLNGYDAYHKTTDPLLREQLKVCPIKQLPTYAGKALEHLDNLDNPDNRDPEPYRKILMERLPECEKESQKTKISRLIKRARPGQ